MLKRVDEKGDSDTKTTLSKDPCFLEGHLDKWPRQQAKVRLWKWQGNVSVDGGEYRVIY